MAEESTTPDLVELVRGVIDATNARDIDAAASFYAPRAVLDLSPIGIGIFEGHAAIRGFYEEWFGTFRDSHQEAEEIRDLGNGVGIAVIVQGGHPPGSSGWVQLRYAPVVIWADGLVERQMTYTDIDEARAAAERLAEERG
jgi:ketosteroid isomerase-like protein